MKKFKVGTFYEAKPGREPRISYVTAYTSWYAAEWGGCIEYEVEAENGAEAKDEARMLRLAHEKRLHGEEGA